MAVDEDHTATQEGKKDFNFTPQILSAEQKFEIVRSIGEECIQEDELRDLLAKNPEPICYDGFEPSGRMHIAQGVMKAIHVKKLISAGCRVKIVIADWFAYINKKMGGDLKKIETVGRYFIEIWKALGMDPDGGKVEFVWSSKEINARGHEYWPLVFNIAQEYNLGRVKRCSEIMGRSEQDDSTSLICYPVMQCADIFFLKVDICQMGMDQREVNVLAREYGDLTKRKNKPIILSHGMLPGLKQGQEKMSTSDPESSIFMDDGEAEVNVKIKKAYCPPKVVEGNPCLVYINKIVFEWFNEFTVVRGEDNGGNKTFKNSEELDADYRSGELHPGDLKPALAKALNKILELVREHFRNVGKAKELQKQVKAISRQVVEKHPLALHPCESKSKSKSKSNPNPETPQILSAEQKFEIVRSIGEECIQEDELRDLLAKKPEPICYDGFEPSGRMHIAQGVMKTINVNKLTSAGCRVKILIADWFAYLNKKMGGDLKKIETVGRYFIEIWKALGMDLDGGKVEFVWSSKEINARCAEYWPRVLDIIQKNNLPRIIRCSQIMGRSEQDELSAAQVFYPCMQCADIFFLEADICQLGMDQRKVNVLAREYCDVIKRKNKPIILSHQMLPGLQQGQEKMSKSDPSSCIFMEDEEAEVNDKIKKAYCPPKVVEGNPCLVYINKIVFERFNEFTVERGEDNGGNKTFKNFEELVVDYRSGELHPGDLKQALAKYLNKILEPVREHFRNDSIAKEVLEDVKGYRVTK